MSDPKHHPADWVHAPSVPETRECWLCGVKERDAALWCPWDGLSTRPPKFRCRDTAACDARIHGRILRGRA